ncbi:MAG: VWA domain-containing protein [Rhodospirillales bacterium]|nr:VWA domain-containing protein [Rhodospirillales bacterium]
MRPQRLSLGLSLCVGVLLLGGLTRPGFAESGRSIALVLDASGSMGARFPDGTSRMDAATAAVVQLVNTLPPDTRLAFRAYGHQSAQNAKNCRDTALLVPFGSVAANKQAIIEQARSLQPRGYTPITYSLTLAAQDLASEEAPSNVVVVVSDGKETCESDPCTAAKALAETDAKLVVHTVGVGVDAETRGQLQCIASNARGSYFDANSAPALARAVGTAAVAEAKPRETSPAPVSSATISTKAASRDQNAPVPLETGEIVRGRLAGRGKMHHYWKVAAPAGRYRVVLDIKLANDAHSNIQSEVIAFRPDGSQLAQVLKTNEIDFRTRAAAESDGEAQPDTVLRVGNNGSSIVDYWLGLFPVDADVPSPYFVRAPKIEPLEFGKPFSATLDPKPGAPAEVWYSTSLRGQDYRISAEFKRLDGKKSNVQAKVEMFGPIGERVRGADDKVCSVNKIDVSAKCVTKLVLAEDAQVLFRLTPSNKAGYRTIFTVEPIN